jgi:[ribosomal protein S5]-alanine N-acetyltransferase
MLPGRPLTDGVVALRPWRPEEAGWYVEQALDPEIQRFTNEPATLTEAEARAAIEDMLATGAHAGLVITDAATGELLGNAGLTADGAVAYWVAAPARGRGIATRAVRLLVAYAETLGILRTTLWTHVDNTGSRRAAEAAGFRLETLDRLEARGSTWDVARYARTASRAMSSSA